MKSPYLTLNQLYLICGILSLSLIVSGCSKQKPAAMASASFDSAPAELKQRWKTAGTYAGKGNYLGAVTNLIFILNNSQQLTPEQAAALNEAWMGIGNHAFQAAEKGDNNATQAVLEMRNSGFSSSRQR